MLKVLCNIALIWLLLIASSSRNIAQGTVNAYLLSYMNASLCTKNVNDKDVIMVLSIGNVAKTDSLFGYNFVITYDTTKVKFDQALKTGTYFELFDFWDVNFAPKGTITGQAVTFSNNPVYGGRYLAAFSGHYLSDCPDTAIAKISFIEFTDEFKKKIVKYVDGKIAGIIKDSSNTFYLTLDKDTLDLALGDSALVVSIDASDNNKVTNAEIDIRLGDTNNFEIKNIKPLSDNISIDSTKNLDTVYKVFTSFKTPVMKEMIISVSVKERQISKNKTIIDIKTEKINKCACAFKFNNAKAEILGSGKDTTTEVNEVDGIKKETIGSYNYINDKIVIKSEKEIRNCYLYNIEGKLIELINPGDKKEINIDAVNLTPGIYLIVTENINNEIDKIIVIKN